ncbi:auxilin-related protein 2 [Amborella trichopoda]|uniref:auxilin-related protein 2 n=1 Tax=Amborella trichopoda TaxID=13333 RepID=UPI0005D43463|nr:auxilin-related protein 2 [Amborella trichopoda]|eukprot:XP_011628921.1 auxilin-related protein 2 [Amborella trichopoda]
MEDFPGLLQRDFGFKPQGKSPPMSAVKGSSSGFNMGGSVKSPPISRGSSKSGWNSEDLFGPSSNQSRHDPSGSAVYDDVFGGPPKFSGAMGTRAPSGSEPFLQGFKDQSKSSSIPVYDKPVYDDDILAGVRGLRSSTGVEYDDVFASMGPGSSSNAAFDDLLGEFNKKEPKPMGMGEAKQDSAFDDLISGFGGSDPAKNRATTNSSRPQEQSIPSSKSAPNMVDDPFVVFDSNPLPPPYSSSGLFTDDPLGNIGMPSNSRSLKEESPRNGVAVDDGFDGFPGTVPALSSDGNKKNKSPLRTGQHSSDRDIENEKPPSKSLGNNIPKKEQINNNRETHQPLFDMPTGMPDSHNFTGKSSFHSSGVNTGSYEGIHEVDTSPKTDGNTESVDDVWLTVDEIHLFTQPTSAPPPSRPPPPLVIKQAPRKVNDYSSFPQPFQQRLFPKTVADAGRTPGISPIDELEDFAMGKPRTSADERTDAISSEEDVETSSAAAASAAAMKEAMDRAEAKLKQAREVRERERDAKSKSREEKAAQEAQEREERERQERLEREREQREREEKERERKRIEEKARLAEREAVERANREARERAMTDARQRAAEKAAAEARERAQKTAVERVLAEARERAAREAKEKAEKAVAEAREREAREKAEKAAAAAAREKVAAERAAVERAAAEVKLRNDRAAVERAYAEARERAAAESREKVAAAAREKQQQKNNNDNDLEAFFGGARPNSAPRQRTATSSDSSVDAQYQNKGTSDGSRRTSTGTSASMRKASSTTNIVDDLSTIFGAAPQSGEFQEIEGESEDRRKARLERHQRTLERAAKALAEKNERDSQLLRDQAERHRIGETLDAEIKRWAFGKEGNLRALLSTLQYVLWPECGWQPVSLTDLITATSVKKVYRKATLCIHPDKVQQKGANIQQKYIAEKVFDILKEAWNKFNSEELF